MDSWFFRRSFWGILLIVIGSIWLLEQIFDFDIPLFSILISLALISLGIALIRGYKFRSGADTNTVFGEGHYAFNATEKGHSVVFGEVVVDFTNTSVFPQDPIELRCVFGEMRVRIPQGLNLEVNAESVFGSVQMPDGNSISFGSRRYTNPLKTVDQPILRINVHCVFGSVVMLLV